MKAMSIEKTKEVRGGFEAIAEYLIRSAARTYLKINDAIESVLKK